MNVKIPVLHEVPFDSGKENHCVYNDGSVDGYTICRYHKLRDRTHGRKAPIERKCPKCALFDVWLDGYNKCKECLICCKIAKQEVEQ